MKFDNSKRMAMVKDLIKDDQKKKSKSKQSGERRGSLGGSNRSLVSASSHSRSSVSSMRSITSQCSSIGADDPFHIKRVMKVQKMWNMLKDEQGAETLGAIFLQLCDDDTPKETSCLVLVETLDYLIHVLSPDMEEDDLLHVTVSLQNENIDVNQLANVLVQAVEAGLDEPLSKREKELWENTVGETLLQTSRLA